jgi:hypothetical protein
MPNNNVLQVQAGTLPSGFCPADYQTILNTFSANQTVILPASASSLQVSATKPSDTTKPWLQLDSLGRPVRIYVFAQGAWIAQHPLVSGFIMIWTGALPDFTVFDGGDGNAIGPYSGPMWQQANTALNGSGTAILAAQVPLGVGTLPSGAAVAVGATGGEETHKLTVQELFPHTHGVHVLRVQHGSVDTNVFTNDTADSAQQPDSTTLTTGGDPATGNPPTAALGHNTLPPYYGVYFLQRTSRLFYAVN